MTGGSPKLDWYFPHRNKNARKFCSFSAFGFQLGLVVPYVCALTVLVCFVLVLFCFFGFFCLFVVIVLAVVQALLLGFVF